MLPSFHLRWWLIYLLRVYVQTPRPRRRIHNDPQTIHWVVGSTHKRNNRQWASGFKHHSGIPNWDSPFQVLQAPLVIGPPRWDRSSTSVCFILPPVGPSIIGYQSSQVKFETTRPVHLRSDPAQERVFTSSYRHSPPAFALDHRAKPARTRRPPRVHVAPLYAAGSSRGGPSRRARHGSRPRALDDEPGRRDGGDRPARGEGVRAAVCSEGCCFLRAGETTLIYDTTSIHMHIISSCREHIYI